MKPECEPLKELFEEFKSTLQDEEDDLLSMLAGNPIQQEEPNLKGWIEALKYAKHQVKSHLRKNRCWE